MNYSSLSHGLHSTLVAGAMHRKRHLRNQMSRHRQGRHPRDLRGRNPLEGKRYIAENVDSTNRVRATIAAGACGAISVGSGLFVRTPRTKMQNI